MKQTHSSHEHPLIPLTQEIRINNDPAYKKGYLCNECKKEEKTKNKLYKEVSYSCPTCEYDLC
jgi:hypothetical protein